MSIVGGRQTKSGDDSRRNVGSFDVATSSTVEGMTRSLCRMGRDVIRFQQSGVTVRPGDTKHIKRYFTVIEDDHPGSATEGGGEGEDW